MYDEINTEQKTFTNTNVPQRKGTRDEQSDHVSQYVMNAEMYSNQAGCFSSMFDAPGFSCNTTHMMNDEIDTETVLWRKEQSVGIKRDVNPNEHNSLLSENMNKDINMRDMFDQSTRVFKSTDSVSMSENNRLLNDLPPTHNTPQNMVHDIIQGFGQDTRQMIKYDKK